MFFKNTIYKLIILLIFILLASLPIIKIPISSSSQGTLRPIEENTKLNAVVNGKVVKTSLIKNNQLIKEGDTLLIVTAEQLDTQKQLQHSQSTDYTTQLNDLNKLTKGQYSGLQTGQYQRELSAMQEKIAQIQT
ncbi:secretion protein HlyD, partial [Elizabethkingia anophelis]|nr:secretion protein HlyD [Elizabethkingia anophelis]